MLRKSSHRTVVTFTSAAFKTVDESVDKPRFRGSHGDDVALWLMREMQNDGIDVVPGLDKADVGWYYAFRMAGRRYVAVINLLDPTRSLWQVTLERDIAGLSAWLGGRRRGVKPAVSKALHAVLARSFKVKQVWWYTERDLKAGNEGKGSPEPMAV